MEYRGFEVFATAIPDEFLSEERKSGGTGKVYTCEIYAARDEGLANVLDVFDLVEGKDIPVNCEDLITPLRMRVDNNYEVLMEKSALSMDRFIKINGAVFSFEEVARALGVECDPKREPVQLHLCQRVDDGVLVAKGAFFDKDEYPAIDLELQLPSEKDSMPVMISRTEQPSKASLCRDQGPGARDQGRYPAEQDDLDSGCGRRDNGIQGASSSGYFGGAYSDGYQGVRNFVYNRDGEYFMYSDVDSRADAVVDRDGMENRVMVSGSPQCSVEVYRENPYMTFKGEQPFYHKVEEPALESVKLEVGMVGRLKDEDGIKKALRGKAFEVTRVDANGVAAGTIEGMQGIYALDKSYIESVMVPENHQDLIDSLAGRMVEFMKEYDFYEFMDSLDAGGEEEAISKIAKELGSIDHVNWFAKFFEELSCDDELTLEMKSESWSLMEALGELEVKLGTKVPLKMQIKNAKGQVNKTTEVSIPDKGEVGLEL